MATFAALLTSLIATLGVRSADVAERWWTSALFFASLALLVLALGLAVRALMPREYVTLGMAYLRRFPTWSEILKPPAQVRGETMRGVIEAIARERDANDVKARSVKRAFALLAFALVLIAIEAITLTVLE